MTDSDVERRLRKLESCCGWLIVFCVSLAVAVVIVAWDRFDAAEPTPLSAGGMQETALRELYVQSLFVVSEKGDNLIKLATDSTGSSIDMGTGDGGLAIISSTPDKPLSVIALRRHTLYECRPTVSHPTSTR